MSISSRSAGARCTIAPGERDRGYCPAVALLGRHVGLGGRRGLRLGLGWRGIPASAIGWLGVHIGLDRIAGGGFALGRSLIGFRGRGRGRRIGRFHAFQLTLGRRQLLLQRFILGLGGGHLLANRDSALHIRHCLVEFFVGLLDASGVRQALDQPNLIVLDGRLISDQRLQHVARLQPRLERFFAAVRHLALNQGSALEQRRVIVAKVHVAGILHRHGRVGCLGSGNGHDQLNAVSLIGIFHHEPLHRRGHFQGTVLQARKSGQVQAFVLGDLVQFHESLSHRRRPFLRAKLGVQRGEVESGRNHLGQHLLVRCVGLDEFLVIVNRRLQQLLARRLDRGRDRHDQVVITGRGLCEVLLGAISLIGRPHGHHGRPHGDRGQSHDQQRQQHARHRDSRAACQATVLDRGYDG